MPPPPGDPKLPEYRQARIRQGGILRVRALNQNLIKERSLAAEKLAEILTTIEQDGDPDSVRAVQRVVDGEKYIRQVCALINKIDEVLCKMYIILEIFKKPYPHHNPEDGYPTLTQKNLGMMDLNLEMAITQLAGIRNGDRPGIIEDLQAFAPDNELLLGLERLNGNMDNFGSRHTRDVIAIMETLDRYLDSVVKGTDLGIAFSVVTTRTQLKIFREISDRLTVQLEVDDEIGIGAQPADVTSWQDLMHTIEFTLANFAVKMTEIYEPNAVFLLSRIEVRSLKNLIRHMQSAVDEQTVKLESAGAQSQIEPTLARRIGTSVASMLRRSPNPGKTGLPTISEQRQNLADAKRTLEDFRKMLQIRLRLER
jgi:hypothetical protein